jgi:hypothetical protein
MFDIRLISRRLRRHLSAAELMSAGAVVAASMGEPTLAHQLELAHIQTASVRSEF